MAVRFWPGAVVRYASATHSVTAAQVFSAKTMRFRIQLEVSARDFGFTGDHTAPNNKTTEESMLFLCEIEAVFELRGRACVIVPGVPCELPPGAASIRPGTELLIVAPDGTELHTTLAAV